MTSVFFGSNTREFDNVIMVNCEYCVSYCDRTFDPFGRGSTGN